jgi:hypothetical protein
MTNEVGILVKPELQDFPSLSLIGGRDPGAGNIISQNVREGIRIEPGFQGVPTAIEVSGNQIYDNGALGIDLTAGIDLLAGDGVTLNDPGDGDGVPFDDPVGPNEFMNFPVLTSARVNSTAPATTTIRGQLDTASPADATVELFANATADPSGHGEGERFLTRTTLPADGTFSVEWSESLEGQYITATATDAAGNTSEFSAAILARAHCEAHSDCNDGFFCNGNEVCRPDGSCAAGGPPCGEGRGKSKSDCDEELNTCYERCASDADCSDGVFCNGAETCELSDGSCQAGASPCTGGSCNEARDSCSTATCGNGICELPGESCKNCALDCNGKTGKNHFCCGHDTDCSDARCSSGLARCEER